MSVMGSPSTTELLSVAQKLLDEWYKSLPKTNQNLEVTRDAATILRMSLAVTQQALGTKHETASVNALRCNLEVFQGLWLRSVSVKAP